MRAVEARHGRQEVRAVVAAVRARRKPEVEAAVEGVGLRQAVVVAVGGRTS